MCTSFSLNQRTAMPKPHAHRTKGERCRANTMLESFAHQVQHSLRPHNCPLVLKLSEPGTTSQALRKSMTKYWLLGALLPGLLSLATSLHPSKALCSPSCTHPPCHPMKPLHRQLQHLALAAAAAAAVRDVAVSEGGTGLPWQPAPDCSPPLTLCCQ